MNIQELNDLIVKRNQELQKVFEEITDVQERHLCGELTNQEPERTINISFDKINQIINNLKRRFI